MIMSVRVFMQQETTGPFQTVRILKLFNIFGGRIKFINRDTNLLS